MKIAEDRYDVGVIIARFQVHRLTEAHRSLIQHVCDHHEKVVLLLGLSAVKATRNNPLDFEARKQMVAAEFPAITILYVNDVEDDERWSTDVDSVLTDVVLTANQTAVLYGSRDSFIPHYSGRYPTRELAQDTFVSGTEMRRQIHTASTEASQEFRAGAIWATGAQHPHVHPTVDVAILDPSGRLLLGQKPREQRWRFIGGFADPVLDGSYEDAARRETREETGLEVSDLSYLGSFLVDDWRYRSEVDRIITLLFLAHVRGRVATAGDDVARVSWFDPAALTAEDIVDPHRPLLTRLTSTLVTVSDTEKDATHA